MNCYNNDRPSWMIFRDITLLELLKQCTFSVDYPDMLEVYFVNTDQHRIYYQIDENNKQQEWLFVTSDRGKHMISVMKPAIIRHLTKMWIHRYHDIICRYTLCTQQAPLYVANAIKSISNAYYTNDPSVVAERISSICGSILPKVFNLDRYHRPENNDVVITGNDMHNVRSLVCSLISAINQNGYLAEDNIESIKQYKEALCDIGKLIVFLSDFNNNTNFYLWELEVPIFKRQYSTDESLLDKVCRNGQLSVEGSICMDPTTSCYCLLNGYYNKEIDINSKAMIFQAYEFMRDEYLRGLMKKPRYIREVMGRSCV